MKGIKVYACAKLLAAKLYYRQ